MRDVRTRLPLCVIPASVALAVASIVAGNASAAFPAAHERLIYTAEGVFGVQVWAIDPSAGAPQALEDPIGIGVNGTVSVSPTGTQLAYTNSIVPDIPGIPASIRRKIRLPQYPVLEYTGVKFQSAVLGGSVSLVTSITQVGGVYSRPAWSPDGKQLAISTGTPGQLHLFVVEAGGTASPQIVTYALAGDSVDPRWSPDGSWIVFTLRDAGSSQLYLVHPDGSGLHRLSDGTARDEQPDFSPDGRRVVFASDRAGSQQLYVVSITGGVPTRLVADPGDDTRPAWSPDGQWIAYTNDNGELHGIDLVGADGQGERQLSSSPGEELVQDWQPLLHTGNPTVHAYPSSGTKAAPIVFRYRAWDDTPITVEFSFEYSTATPSLGETESDAGPPFSLPDFRSQAVRRYTAKLSDVFGGDAKGAAHVTKSRFCVLATDGWGNHAASCNTFHR